MVDDCHNHQRVEHGKFFAGGHGEGTTSVDEEDRTLYAIDRTSQQVVIIDPAARRVVARAALASAPDYVRQVATTRELWVSRMPSASRSSAFRRIVTVSRTSHSSAFRAARSRWLSTAPEVVHSRTSGRERAWQSTSDRAASLRDAEPMQPRGIAYDERLHFPFAGCAEGKAAGLDTMHDGAVLATAAAGSGVDIIDYDPVRRHLYLPGARSATMTIFAVAANGRITPLATTPTASGAHCVVTDGRDAYVCDPNRGRILVSRLLSGGELTVKAKTRVDSRGRRT